MSVSLCMRRRDLLGGIAGLSSFPVLFSGYDSCRGASIVAAVDESEVSDLYDPWRGDCWHIAVALHDAYDVDLRGFYHSNDNKYPVHVFVEYDGSYYDGYGRLDTTDLFDEWPETIREVMSFTREDVTEVPYYNDVLRVNIYDLIVDTWAYSSWSGC